MEKDQESDVKWSETYQLEIDCQPGSARPDTILALVLGAANTPLTSKDFKVTGKLFGEWTFVVKEDKEEEYAEARKKIGEQLKILNAQGAIRFASW